MMRIIGVLAFLALAIAAGVLSNPGVPSPDQSDLANAIMIGLAFLLVAIGISIQVLRLRAERLLATLPASHHPPR